MARKRKERISNYNLLDSEINRFYRRYRIIIYRKDRTNRELSKRIIIYKN
jgi:hypothetical protein